MLNAESRAYLKSPEMLLMLMASAVPLSFATWSAMINNFTIEVAGFTGKEFGLLQSIREIPGFLAFAVIFFLILVREQTLAVVSLLLMGIGTAITGYLPSAVGLYCTTLLMSFGFHYYETTNQSLTLQYYDRERAPLVFGALRSAGAATNIAVGVLIFGLSTLLDYRQMFLLIGLTIAGVGVWGLLQNPTDRDLLPSASRWCSAGATGCSTSSPSWPAPGGRSSSRSRYSCW